MRRKRKNDKPTLPADRRPRYCGVPRSRPSTAIETELPGCRRGIRKWSHLDDERAGRDVGARDRHQRRYHDEFHAPDQSESARERDSRNDIRCTPGSPGLRWLRDDLCCATLSSAYRHPRDGQCHRSGRHHGHDRKHAAADAAGNARQSPVRDRNQHDDRFFRDSNDGHVSPNADYDRVPTGHAAVTEEEKGGWQETRRSAATSSSAASH